MIPPLAVTAPPEPATAPHPRHGDRFAGALANALAHRTRRDRQPATTDAQGPTLPATEREQGDGLDADATTSAGGESVGGEPPDTADSLMGALAIAGGAAATENSAATAEAVPPVAVEAAHLGATTAPATVAAHGTETAWAAAAVDVERTAVADAAPVVGDRSSDAAGADAMPDGHPNPLDPATTVDRAGLLADDDRAAAIDADRPTSTPPPTRPGRGTERAATATAPAPLTVALDARPAAKQSSDADHPGDTEGQPPSLVITTGDRIDRPGTAGPGAPEAPPAIPTATAPPTGAPPTAAAPPASHATSAAPAAPPAGRTNLAAGDAIRFLRELGPARAVQRLAVDLDGAMVAVRVDQTGATPSVRVQIVDDPAGRLDRSWATSVERTLSQSMQRDGSGSQSGQRRRESAPHPDDLQPQATIGQRWAAALGEPT